MKTDKNKDFTEKLWYCGKEVGQINGILTFENLPILNQMKIGVLTTTGIRFTSRPILLENESFDAQKKIKDDDPVRKFFLLKNKLLSSDQGLLKKRLTFFERIELLK